MIISHSNGKQNVQNIGEKTYNIIKNWINLLKNSMIVSIFWVIV